MEELLLQVVTISNNFADIQKAAQGAVDFLGLQQGLIRDPAYELREKCLLPLQLCLETKRSKFTVLAIAGFHKVIRDDRFHSNIEPEDDSKWLPMQLLQATSCFLSLSEDTQVDILKLYLNIACSKKWTMNGRTVIAVICLCSEAFESGNAAVRAAAQAAASQTLSSFSLILEEDINERDLNASNFNEIIPVMQFLCSKVDEAEGSSHCEHGVTFHLECLLTLFSSLPRSIHLNKHLRTFLWQKFCPVLISVLGTPKVDKHIVTRFTGIEKEKGRGSGGLGTAPSFNSFHAKTVYSINTELVRLVGCVASLQPVLESIFHRVLLYPAPNYRLDALKAVTELVRNPNRLIDMAGPMVDDKAAMTIGDMSLLRLIMDSIEESVKYKFCIMEASVMCSFGLLKALEELCLGRCIPTETAVIICNMYPKLSDCDYKGPRTYQSLNRLPQLYRERIQKETELLRKTDGDDTNDGLEQQYYDSDSSGETEGPEDEHLLELRDVELERSGGKIPTILNVEPYDVPISHGDTERQRARHFVSALHELLPLLMPMRSSIQVDQALQGFASQYCEGIMSEQPLDQWGVINADGLYLATYSALLLDMKLFQSDYYLSFGKQIIMTEFFCHCSLIINCKIPDGNMLLREAFFLVIGQMCRSFRLQDLLQEDFVMRVQGIGVAYLSSIWLRELYQAVVSSSLLQTHGYLPTNNNSQPHALINLLTDIEGLESYQQGSQMLWECRRLEKPVLHSDDNLEREAGLRLSRRILSCCWKTVLKVLAIPLSKRRFASKREKLRDLKFLGKDDHNKQVKQIITTSIEGLQIAARLCNILGLQDKCGNILELLVSASHSESASKKPGLIRIQTANGSDIRLTPSHALSLDLVLGSGLELGSHCSECWPHVFSCCIYVRKLEHKYFSKSENRALGSTTKVTRKEENTTAPKEKDLTLDPQLDEDTCIDVYSFLCSTELPETVSEIVSTPQQASDVLKSSETAKVICILSQLVDKLFEDAALKLNLKSLGSFSKALCISSHVQLFPPSCNTECLKSTWWQKLAVLPEPFEDSLLLDSVGEFMLKCVRSGRPLFHVIRIWSIISSHLLEAACHKDLTISRKAVKHIHDIANAILSEHSELPHFHVNEMLFKPFESLLGLELCEPDVQDQIVSCICEFVETSFTEIRSGWRPLFAALRAVSTNLNILLDVFRVFLEMDNVLVFSNAAIDYIMCLLKHLRSQSSMNHTNTEIVFETLKYLKRCENILASMYKIPHSFVFHSARHIQDSDGLLVDPAIPDLEGFKSERITDDLKFESDVSYSFLVNSLTDRTLTLDTIDRQSGVLRVWFLLLEGLHSAAISASSFFQPSLLDMLYTDLTKLIDEPGPLFGLFVFNRLILPMTQSWLRQLSKIPEGDFSGLKQSLGLLSDSVLHYFDALQNDSACENDLTLLLNQVLLLLVECCVHPIPAVARIGPVCMRHIITNAGKTFTDDQWELATLALHKSFDTTLIFLQQLMAPFSVDSQYYYGDAGQVKVAARRGATAREIVTSLHLSQQVFLLDEQREGFIHNYDDIADDQKIYTFLVSVSDEDIVRISMKSLVIALMSHQSILQIIAEILLQGTEHYISSLANVLNRNSSQLQKEKSAKACFPGLLGQLKTSKLKTLLSCLDYSCHCAISFDSRPGLKFLIQKVAGLEQAANLYRQTGAAWAIKLVCLFEYCIVSIERAQLSCEEVKKLLENSEQENDISFFLNEFRKSFDDLCETYINLVLDGTASASKSPEKAGRPLFFLIASQDDQFPEITKKDGEEFAEEEPQKPFVLADFCRKSNSSSFDSDDQTHCKDEGEQKETEQNSEENVEKWKEEENEVTESEKAHLEVLQEYKKKKKYFFGARKTVSKCSNEPLVPPEIEQQRRRSFLKDSEALHRVWTEMLSSVFELLQQLSDEEFRKLLPVYIDGVRRLMVCVSEPVLKKAVSELFQRIAVVYGFGKV